MFLGETSTFIQIFKYLIVSVNPPFNLPNWIAQNRDLLKPPVGNKNLYYESGDFIIMVVGGPNSRKDFHYNETEELFYQLEGTIKVHIQEDGQRKTFELGPGDMYLNPARVLHSPERSKGSEGLVIERKREHLEGQDGLVWFCENCNHKLHEVYFPLRNIETDFLQHFKNFEQNSSLHTCSNCGHKMDI